MSSKFLKSYFVKSCLGFARHDIVSFHKKGHVEIGKPEFRFKYGKGALKVGHQ